MAGGGTSEWEACLSCNSNHFVTETCFLKGKQTNKHKKNIKKTHTLLPFLINTVTLCNRTALHVICMLLNACLMHDKVKYALASMCKLIHRHRGSLLQRPFWIWWEHLSKTRDQSTLLCFAILQYIFCYTTDQLFFLLLGREITVFQAICPGKVGYLTRGTSP